MTKDYRPFHPRCPTRSRARVRLSLCVLIMGANVELMTSASSAATSPAAPVEMTTAASDFFYHADDLYNVMAISDAAGAVVERYEYGDYGQPVDPSTLAPIAGNPSAIGNPYLFTGRRYDPETGWYYYRTRYLDPIAGRFTTRDTIGIWGDTKSVGNTYMYAVTNPTTLVDPRGRAPCEGACEGSDSASKVVNTRCEEISDKDYKNITDALKKELGKSQALATANLLCSVKNDCNERQCEFCRCVGGNYDSSSKKPECAKTPFGKTKCLIHCSQYVLKDGTCECVYIPSA